MTNKEALISVIGLATDNQVIDKSLIDNGIDGTKEYTIADSTLIEVATIDVLFSVYMVSSKGEGDISISHNIDGIKSRLLYLAKKHNRKDIVSIVSNRNINTISVW